MKKNKGHRPKPVKRHPNTGDYKVIITPQIMERMQQSTILAAVEDAMGWHDVNSVGKNFTV